ncbi:MAG: hypothetical protein GAK34_01675 [Delftia tsuruhatensis]|jgi:hypothetical protein|nr:MAG: hypothetical protein GAK34_01675 [Delftia tsuruhatensis]TQL87386.1 hypothetical protein FB549_0142 [Delftia sp. HK171]
MVDLILLTFCVGMFAAGFWAGAKFKRPSEMLKAAKDWLK